MQRKQHNGNPDRLNVNGTNEQPRWAARCGNTKGELKAIKGRVIPATRYLKGQ
jgi:hypothetical protein